MILKWIGKEKGMAGIIGIPARDLTEEEVDRYGIDLLLESGLYKEVKSYPRAVSKTSKPAPKVKNEKKEGEE